MTSGKKTYIIISWIAVVVCMGIIFCLSAQTADESSELSGSFIMALLEWFGLKLEQEVIRTIAHCLEFMGLSLLIFNATYTTWATKLTPVIAFAGTVFYAITDEIHQIFVPGRAFQLTDILVDGTGALLGAIASLILLKVILYIKERRNRNGSTQAL